MAEKINCPVCGKELEPNDPNNSKRFYKDRMHTLCGLVCAQTFIRDPTKYVKEG